MKILVVEDDPLVADDLVNKLEQLMHRVTGIADSYQSATTALETEMPDLVLLDIELDGEQSGIDLGEKLRKLGIAHIYLSGIQDMNTYMRAKNTFPLRNLAKPIDLINLRNALDIEPGTLKRSSPLIYLMTDGNKTRQRISPDEIYFIEADGSYCSVHFEGKMFKLTMNLKACLQKLEWPEIIRVSKSHAINLQYVKSKLGNCIEMANGTKIDVEPMYKDSVSLHLKSI